MKLSSNTGGAPKMTLIKHSRNHTSTGANLKGADAQALKLPWKSAGGVATEDSKVVVPAQAHKVYKTAA